MTMRPLPPARAARSRRGANALEFALILPFFLALVAGIMEYGWAFWQRTTLVDIVRYGCRAGSVVSPSEGDPAAVAVQSMKDWAGIIHRGMACDDASGGACTVSAEVRTSTSGVAELTCVATIEQYAPLLGLPIIPQPDGGVSAESIIRLELQP